MARKSKRHFYIIKGGRQVGETWAVSAEKALANYWWKNCKQQNQFTRCNIKPDDYDVIEA